MELYVLSDEKINSLIKGKDKAKHNHDLELHGKTEKTAKQKVVFKLKLPLGITFYLILHIKKGF